MLCFVFLLCLAEMDVIFENRQCHGMAVSEQPIVWEPTAGSAGRTEIPEDGSSLSLTGTSLGWSTRGHIDADQKDRR